MPVLAVVVGSVIHKTCICNV